MGARVSGAGLRGRVEAFLRADDWPHEATETGFTFGFAGEHGQWGCFAWVREEQGQVVFYSYPPVEVGPETMAAVMEFITRANFGLAVGGFELHLESGTLQFRTSIDVEDSEKSLTAQVLEHLLYHNVLTMDKYLPGLRAVIEQTATPEAAIIAVEGAPPELE